MGYTACLCRLGLAVTLLCLCFAFAVVAAPAQAQHPQRAQQQPDDSSDDVANGEPADDGWHWPNDDDADPDDGAYQPEPEPEPQPQPVPEPVAPPLVTSRTVAGKVAMLRADGKAAIPRGAPKRVRVLIAHANQIVGKPYKWGGGHAKLVDRGYDCSGAVSYPLIKAGMLRSPMVSGAFKRWGSAGEGRWISVYAHKGHVYVEVAGLRLDTSSVGDTRERTGVRWRPVIGKRPGFTPRHPVRL